MKHEWIKNGTTYVGDTDNLTRIGTYGCNDIGVYSLPVCVKNKQNELCGIDNLTFLIPEKTNENIIDIVTNYSFEHQTTALQRSRLYNVISDIIEDENLKKSRAWDSGDDISEQTDANIDHLKQLDDIAEDMILNHLNSSELKSEFISWCYCLDTLKTIESQLKQKKKCISDEIHEYTVLLNQLKNNDIENNNIELSDINWIRDNKDELITDMSDEIKKDKKSYKLTDNKLKTVTDIISDIYYMGCKKYHYSSCIF